ncbi:Ima1 N-terminal domain-containing protein [Suillus clintonianus]|uniref:Ima1 N-terminal domain-containing protein n=1 Tax=Suillus clintonianus TaxID=1904413 RepID=UPI001B87F4E3|nr:Ima1 N-terminal domain-containing protein [Suillus clintonianus]KAG2154677.1 Ima1 N-terminal domain-containing protein [Suillus clintonianus]
MPPLFRHTSSNICFFCRSTIKPAPPDPRSFRCPHCDCWNRYDANGEIMSDEPAMHDESLNSKSFAKRASPSKDRLPSMYGTGQFCHTCQTNQMLLVNLLSNYLPPPHHPDYAQRLEKLPEYRESLHVRYPPVCADCMPAVEEEIRKKDHMARTKALGGWLNDSRGKEKQRQAPGSSREREKLQTHLFLWRLRGFLWFTTLAIVVVAHSSVVLRLYFPDVLGHVRQALPLITLCSLFWTAWDPTYYSFRKARIQGRDLRVRGKKNYIILQMTAWFSRLLSSILLALSWHAPSRDYLHLSRYPASSRTHYYCLISLIVEVLICATSFVALRVQKPPPIRLIDTSSHQHLVASARPTPELSPRSSPAPHTQIASEPDLLASLSLSSNPVISPGNPIFGLPSLVSSNSTYPSSRNNAGEDEDEDAMDWTPTVPSPAKPRKILNDDDDGSWVRPQRFFAPERPTGLESLFASTKLDDRDQKTSSTTRPIRARTTLHLFVVRWWWAGAASLILVPAAALGFKFWRGMEMTQDN